MMKKLLGLVVLISGAVFSQDLDNLVVDSLAMDSVGMDSIEKEPPAYYAALYLSTEARFAPNFGGVNLVSGVSFGVQYNKWQLGFNVYDFQGTIESLVIFPNAFSLDYRYAGPWFGYELYDNRWFSFDLIASYGIGDMIWEDLKNNIDFFRDEFNMVTIGVYADLDRFRYAKPYFTIGYQHVNDLVLERVKNNEFTGMFFGFGIRIGYFNQ